MKYQVVVAGRTLDVEVEGDRVTVDGRELRAELRPIPGTPLSHLLVDGASWTIPLTPVGRGTWEAGVAGETWPVEVIDERTRHIRSLTGGGARAAGPAVLKAPMPGMVVRVLAEPGMEVAAGAGLVVLEAMKMENELRAPAAATVRAVHVSPGQTVEKGQVLAEFGDPDP
jgi:biotin carboxyl carrier protein